MTNFQLCLILATICSAAGSTAWWVNGSINQVRADMTQSTNKVENGLTKVQDGLTEVKVDLTQSIGEVRVDLTEVKVDMTQSFGEVRGDIRVLGTRVGGLEADVKDLKTDVKGLQTDVKGLQTDVKDLQTDVKGLQIDVKDLQTDVKGKVKVNSLEDDVRDNNEYLREHEIQSVPKDASMSETPIPKEDPVKLRKISAENTP